MPELPSITVYVECMEARIVGRPLEGARIPAVALLRTAVPPIEDAVGRVVCGVSRLGKRIVWEMEDELFLVFHLMIAGRFRWKKRGVAIPRKAGQAAFDFPNGSLLLTEQGAMRRASLHVALGREALAAHDPGGLEPLNCTLAQFRKALAKGNHTLKRALTDPRTYSGIGKAYSDEILHRARLSPLQWTSRLSEAEQKRLWQATRKTLREWTKRLRDEVGDGFPDKVTAFHPKMAVHGKYREPCPVCGDPVQRIVYAKTETNYCATCQTSGRVLADRALSRLLKQDWPRTLDGWEALREGT